jgi:hypothetical protein
MAKNKQPSLSKTTRKSRTIVFGAWHYWNIAADCAQRALDTKAAKPDVCTADTLPAVIMASVAVEAFINELAYHLDDSIADCGTDVTDAGQILKMLEDDHASVALKYKVVSRLLPGKPLRAGQAPLQDLEVLIRLRNKLAHPVAQESTPAFVTQFCKRGWTYDSMEEGSLVGWIFQIETPEVAAWACRVAYSSIWNIISRFNALPENVWMLLKPLEGQWRTGLSDTRISTGKV